MARTLLIVGYRLGGPPGNSMKVLIAYDGSQCSESALDDLERAGLPEKGEVLIITVAEVWLPPPDADGLTEETDEFIEDVVRRHREKGERWLAEAGTMVKHAQARVRRVLPGWKVEARATYGSPAWEVLSAADELKPDLLVTGSHGQSALSRFVLGSISHKILIEAHCSVRVARGRADADPTPMRIVIGFDGSAGAFAAVDAVANRQWQPKSEIHLVAATDSIVPTAIGRFIPPVADWAEDELRSEYAWIAKLAERATRTLRRSGLIVKTRIVEGRPNHILVREAESWHADCIFVGANAFGSRLERFLLGSTSAAVAARAHCSVEVVRRETSA
jgi:nucleotide-binding universal stress UspA family protein